MEVALEGITDLPTSIIETILTFLPLRDAVRTSILSKRWRYLWANIPKLVFDDTLCITSGGEENGDKVKLLFIMYQVLLLHHGPLNEFTLSISKLEGCSEIDQFILYLSRRITMKKFTLCITKGETYKVPTSLFSCQNLTHLKLHSCGFELPPMIGGFNSLISLEFDEVIFTAEVLCNFISKCPLLEKLSLISSRVFDSIELDAPPSLKYLELILELKSLSLKNVTHLVNVSILIKESPKEEYPETSNMIQLFDSLPLIENLQIDFHFIKVLSACGVPNKLPTSLVHLRYLCLSEICLSLLCEVSVVLCLITSTPNLEELTLQLHNLQNDPSVNIGVDVLEFFQAKDFSEAIWHQLRLVKMEGVLGVSPELEFVKLLLAKSPKLEKMLIKPQILDDKGLKMLTDMIEFERASPKAKIIFGEK